MYSLRCDRSTRTLAPLPLPICVAIWIALTPPLVSAEVIRHTTPGGHDFLYVQMPEADRTAIVVHWESTWVHRAEHPTAAHIGAILMTSGGTGGDLEALIRQSREVGAHAELNATADGARGLLVAPDGRLEEAAALARQALTGARLDAVAFERVRAGLSRSVRAAATTVEAPIWDAAQRLLLGDSPLFDFLRLPVDDIEGATLAEVRAWRDAVFAQANATIAAAGIAPATDVAAAVDTLLEGLPNSPAAEPVRAPQPGFGGRTVLIVAPAATSSAFGVFGPVASTGESLLDVLAFEAVDRRLARGLRREYGDALDVSARPVNYARDIRLLSIVGEVATEELEGALEVTRDVYERFRVRGPTPRETMRGARHAARMFEGVQEVPEAAAQTVLELVLDGEPVVIADDLPGRLRDVERDALRAHVNEVFPVWDQMLRIIIAPDVEAVTADCVIDTLDAAETCR